MNEKITKVNGPYQISSGCAKGRFTIDVYYRNGRKRTVSFPKFLVEVLLDRKLHPRKETIDHIDKNYENNAWSNLRIIPISRHAREDAIKASRTKLRCVWCKGKVPPKRIKEYNLSNKPGPFCGKRCTGQYGAAVQHGKIKPFPTRKKVNPSYKRRSKHSGIKVSSLPEARKTSLRDVLDFIKQKTSKW